MSPSHALAIDLRERVRGRVLLAGDDAFDHARKPWNLAVDQRPLAVVEAADADDVAALVGYARAAGLTIAAQPSGHGASGDVEGVILLRTSRLDDLEVRPEERVARAGPGVNWGRLLAGAGAHGLIGLAGSSPVVGVVGYTLGGGLSWFSRRHGLASSSVRSFDVVDADGIQSTVTASSDPDLYWALRGGGGDFALVTTVEFDLHPAPELYGGRIMWPAERAPEVLDAFTAVTAQAPEELTLWFDLLQFPQSPPFVAIDSTYLGPATEGQALLRDFEGIDDILADSRRALPVAELGSITAEPTEPSAGMSQSELLAGLDEATANQLSSAPIYPLLSVQVRHLGGALDRPSDSAAGCVEAPYLLYMFGVPSTPEVATKIAARREDLVRSLGPAVTDGQRPYTLLRPGQTAADAFPADVLARLREIKRRRDPHGVFRSNYPVLVDSTDQERKEQGDSTNGDDDDTQDWDT